MTNLSQVGVVRDRNEISPEIMNPLNEKVRTVTSGSDIDTYKTSLLDTNPPFDPTKHYERDTRYNIRKYEDQFNLLPKNPTPFIKSNIFQNNIFNPAPNGKIPYSELRRR
jgi:hypothetical protein